MTLKVPVCPLQVSQGNVPGVESASLAMDTEEGVEVVWNEVLFSDKKVFKAQEVLQPFGLIPKDTKHYMSRVCILYTRLYIMGLFATTCHILLFNIAFTKNKKLKFLQMFSIYFITHITRGFCACLRVFRVGY